MQQCSLLLRKKKKPLLICIYIYYLICIKVETQKIANRLNSSDNESSKYATKKWYIIIDQNNQK